MLEKEETKKSFERARLKFSLCGLQYRGVRGMTMYLTGGNTEMIPMSCFSNMKIYTRFVAVNVLFSYFASSINRANNTVK